MPTAGDNNLSRHNQVVKAEMLRASHVTEKNSLFKSCNEIADLFKMIFLGSPVGVETRFFFTLKLKNIYF